MQPVNTAINRWAVDDGNVIRLAGPKGPSRLDIDIRQKAKEFTSGRPTFETRNQFEGSMVVVAAVGSTSRRRSWQARDRWMQNRSGVASFPVRKAPRV